MKVKIEGKVYTAKRFRDLTPREVKNATLIPSLWDGDELFIELKELGCWKYIPFKVEIVEG